MVNLSSILHSTEVNNTIPSVAKTFTPPTIVYSLDSPIASKIFNFNKFVTSLDVNSFLKDNSILPCHCANSSFSDKHHGHIVTGNLGIIQNNRLRKLFSKGPKFRESKYIDWNVIENELLEFGKNVC